MKKRAGKPGPEIAIKGINTQPDDVTELVNKYGTYNIQPTSASDNEFPAIGQKGALNKKRH